MKRLILPTIILLVLLSLVTAQGTTDDTAWLLTNQHASYDVRIGTSFIPQGVDEVQARLSLFPRKDDRTEVLSQENIPKASEEGDDLIFTWNAAQLRGEQKLSVNNRVETTNTFPKITEKVPYPLKTNEFREYLQSTDSVDVNDPRVIALVEELTRGEDDSFIVVEKLANWVEQNVEYSLDTVTAEASQSSSWVLENKRGVCDELTNLFIAFARAAGIPARFVSGVSFTNSPLFPEGWGLHGWAEVYLPNYGWVPVDVTYNQIGRIDLGHIPLKYAADANDASIKYQWKGGTLDSKKLDADAELLSTEGVAEKLLSITAHPVREQAGFGSYNVIEVELENLQDYYVADALFVSVSDSLELIDPDHRMVVIKPKEKKKVHWLFKVKSSLDTSYKYTSYAKVKSSQEEVQTSIVSVAKDKVYSQNDLREYTAASSVVGQGDFLVDLRCASDTALAAIGENVAVSCFVKNTASKKLVGLEFCVDTKCETFALDKNEEKSLNGEVEVQHEGIQNIIVSVRNDEVNNIEVLPIDVEKSTEVLLTLEVPAEMSYNEEASFTFRVDERKGSPQNVSLAIYLNNKHIKTSNLDELGGISLGVEGKLLSAGDNTVRYELSYHDRTGKVQMKEGNATVRLVNLSFWQRIKIFFRDLLG